MSTRTGEHVLASPGVQRVKGRLLSLDVVKGLMLVVSVGVNSLWAAPRWFEHAPWAGVHPVDLVFVTLSGCGLAFAMRRGVVLGPPECNPSGVIDVSVFGAAHTYAGGALGHDPEGLFAISGALVSAAAGAVIGHLLLDGRPPPRPAATGGGRRAAAAGGPVRTAASLLLLALTLAGAAWVSGHAPTWFGQAPVPAMKRLWTAPFALAVASGVALALRVASSVLDRPSTSSLLRTGATPLIALGRNSLLVYFGSHVLMAELDRTDGTLGALSIAQRAAGALAVFGHPQVTWTVLLVLSWSAVAVVLHARRIYLRP